MGNLPPHSALLTDLYELTMAAAYFEDKLEANATFELFVRSLPAERSFLIAAGLEQALDFLEQLRFSDDEVQYLREQPAFHHISPKFFDYLKEFRFTGEVWAVAEGTPVFAEEPLLRVTAPIIAAQIVETFLLSTLTFQTMIASKAARIVSAAQGRRVIEFGSRRAHGPEAGVLAARAAYIGGCAGTSNVEAGRRFGVPVFGTLAHSFVMAYAKEEDAFRKFQQLFPERSVLIVDTYDTREAVEKIIENNMRPTAIRLDSGDLLELSVAARERLDEAGLRDTKIFASGDLDEYAITELVARGARIDAFGVGTALATSKDAPALGGVYKLVDIESGGVTSYRAKFSEDKATYPGRKQVFRFYDSDGNFQRDIIACADEGFDYDEQLLECVMQNGKRLHSSPDLSSIQQRAREQIERIPERCSRLRDAKPYPVTFSECLKKLLGDVRGRMKPRTGPATERSRVL
ncbi:MAG TPA: nicotinate phosphoribosyltransferase [Terriglobales bacterium]|nr:nicotinate phosphoribosyltransferase [Terriglobales bacterium]